METLRRGVTPKFNPNETNQLGAGDRENATIVLPSARTVAVQKVFLWALRVIRNTYARVSSLRLRHCCCPHPHPPNPTPTPSFFCGTQQERKTEIQLGLVILIFFFLSFFFFFFFFLPLFIYLLFWGGPTIGVVHCEGHVLLSLTNSFEKRNI